MGVDMKNKDLELNSMQPMDDGGRKYNIIYYITVILGGLFGIGGGIVGIFAGAALGLFVGWLIKNQIMDYKAYKFRYYSFRCNNKPPFDQILNVVIPKLTPMYMRVELDSDGNLVITHDTMIYDVIYNEDNSFSLWWRKNIGGAFLTANYINMYRCISADMGIIGYTIQKALETENISKNDQRNSEFELKVTNIPGEDIEAMKLEPIVENVVAPKMNDIDENITREPTVEGIPESSFDGLETKCVLQNNTDIMDIDSEVMKKKAGKMFCGFCGAKLNVEALYCPHCGKVI